ncbi:MAG: O-antigen ligase family protein [Gammaproteobacteria bacterium]|nr:O-antigen ligase family protein [Gammaproteobacteria bacterium]
MPQSFLSKFIVACIGVMPFLTPSIWFVEWFSASPEYLKTAWGVSCVSIALTWWIYNQVESKEFKVVKSDLYLPIFGFLLWCFTTLLWIEDGYLAAIMLAQFSSFFVIFVLIVNTFKYFDWAVGVLKVLVFSMTLVSIIGLLQYYFPGNDFIQHLFLQSAKPGATFANKNMASHFIVMTLPLSLMLMLASKVHIKIALYSLTTFIGSWFLIYTVARQAYVAVAVELLILGIFIAIDRYKNHHQSLLSNLTNKPVKKIALIGIVALLALVSNLTNEGWRFSSDDKLDRVKSINMEGSSGRLPAWVNTLEMIKDNPIAGVGIGQWPQSYPLYYDRVMEDQLFNEKLKLKRLHNDFLETFSNVGLIGYLFLIWLLFLISRKIFGVLSDINNPYRIYILGVSLGLIGFSIVAMFSFPIRVYLPAFLVFVYFAIIFLSTQDYSVKRNIIKYKFEKRSYTGLILAFSLSIFLLIYSYHWTKALHYFNQSHYLSKNSELYTPALAAGLKALEHNNWSKLYYANVGDILMKMKQYQKAEPYFKKVVDVSPYNSTALLRLAEIYSKSANPREQIKQRKVLEFILSFDPKNVTALSYLIRNLASNERGQDATIAYMRLKKAFEYFKGRSNFGPYHHNVGLVATSVGDYEYAKYIYEDAIERFPTAKNYHRMAILEYDFLKNHKKGVGFARRALEIDPDMQGNKAIKALIEKYESSTQQ